MEEKIIGRRYQYIRPLGKGGNGSVFLCMDMKLQKQWAVKELEVQDNATLEESKDVYKTATLEESKDVHGTAATRPSKCAPFLSELELLKTISCNLFPRIVDVVMEPGCVYLIMDYVEGISLMGKMRRQKLTEKEVLTWAVEIAEALRYLHQMSPQILYLDCKPENIMLTPQGEIRLVDLGSVYVCRSEQKQRISGTRFFSPMEQQCGSRDGSLPDVRSDIYAFGMTLYYLLTGKKRECRRFGRLWVRDLNPAVSHGLNALIARCTEKDPGKRYQSMEEVLYQLKHIKELNRQERAKSRIWKVTEVFAKGGLALLFLDFVASYVQTKGTYYLTGSLLAFAFFVLACRYRGGTVYEVKKEVFCGCGKRLLGYGIVLLGVLQLMKFSVLAEEKRQENTPDPSSVNVQMKVNTQKKEELAVTLHDWQGRKILLKDGACWEISEDILLSIPVEEISETEGEIIVMYREGTSGETKECVFGVVRRE